MSFGLSHVAPILPSLYMAYPNIRIDLQLDDGPDDLVAAGFDVGVRIGWPRDSTLRSRKLLDVPFVIVAAPSYLDRAGVRIVPEDLAHHDCLANTNVLPPDKMAINRFAGRGKAGADPSNSHDQQR